MEFFSHHLLIYLKCTYKYCTCINVCKEMLSLWFLSDCKFCFPPSLFFNSCINLMTLKTNLMNLYWNLNLKQPGTCFTRSPSIDDSTCNHSLNFIDDSMVSQLKLSISIDDSKWNLIFLDVKIIFLSVIARYLNRWYHQSLLMLTSMSILVIAQYLCG